VLKGICVTIYIIIIINILIDDTKFSFLPRRKEENALKILYSIQLSWVVQPIKGGGVIVRVLIVVKNINSFISSRPALRSSLPPIQWVSRG
jgi:hypothetical protein